MIRVGGLGLGLMEEVRSLEIAMPLGREGSGVMSKVV